MKKICLLLLAAIGTLGATDVKILERVILAPKYFELEPGQIGTWHVKMMKLSGSLDPEVRIGLR